MRNSKDKSKRNLAIPGEPMSQKKFKELIKEAEKGPFSPLGNLVEDIKLIWEKKQKTEGKTNTPHPDESFSKEEFVALVKEGEKGPFTPLGSFEEFRSEILNIWKKKRNK